MKNTHVMIWAVAVGATALGGCDLVAGIGKYCEIGVDPGCGAGGTGGETNPGGGGTGAAGGAAACSPVGATLPCYSGPVETKDVGVCVGGMQTCQDDGTWGTCDGEVVPGIETCASDGDEDCNSTECALWSHIFGDANQQDPLAVAFDSQGNVLLLGAFTGKLNLGGADLQSTEERDLFLAKFSPGGEHIWSKKYGDSGDQWRGSLAVDSNDNIIVVGTFEGTIDFGGGSLTAASGGTDLFIAKLTPEGVQAWSQHRGDGADQSAVDVTVDSNDNVLLVGEFSGSVLFKNQVTASNGADVYVACLASSDGYPLWQLTFDDKESENGTLRIAAGAGGVWAIAGKHGNGASMGGGALVGFNTFVSKFGDANASIWSVSVPVSTPSGLSFDSGDDVVLSADITGTVVIEGSTLVSKGEADIALLKLNGTNGAVQWADSFGGAGNDQVARIALADDDRIFFAFVSASTKIDFGGGELTGKGQHDLFVVALTSDGAHFWSRSVGDATFQLSPKIAFDRSGNSLAVAIRSNGTVNFGAGDLKSNSNDVAIAKLAP